jgi:hypothetical protein
MPIHVPVGYGVGNPLVANVLISFTGAVAWIRIGKQVMQLSATYPFLGKASILAANDTLLNWLKSVPTSN